MAPRAKIEAMIGSSQSLTNKSVVIIGAGVSGKS